jgi:hypothetical protein
MGLYFSVTYMLKLIIPKKDQYVNANFMSPTKLLISYNVFILLKNESKYPFISWEDYINKYIVPDIDFNASFNVACIRRITKVRRATLIDEALGSYLYAIRTDTHRSGLFRLCSRSQGKLYQGVIRNCLSW